MPRAAGAQSVAIVAIVAHLGSASSVERGEQLPIGYSAPSPDATTISASPTPPPSCSVGVCSRLSLRAARTTRGFTHAATFSDMP